MTMKKAQHTKGISEDDIVSELSELYKDNSLDELQNMADMLFLLARIVDKLAHAKHISYIRMGMKVD